MALTTAPDNAIIKNVRLHLICYNTRILNIYTIKRKRMKWKLHMLLKAGNINNNDTLFAFKCAYIELQM